MEQREHQVDFAYGEVFHIKRRSVPMVGYQWGKDYNSGFMLLPRTLCRGN